MPFAARRALQVISALALTASLLMTGCNTASRSGWNEQSGVNSPRPRTRVLEGVPISAIDTATWIGDDGVISVNLDWSNGAQATVINAYVGCAGLSASQLAQYVPNTTLQYGPIPRPTNLPANQQRLQKLILPLTHNSSLPTPPPLTIIYFNGQQQGPASASLVVLQSKNAHNDDSAPLMPVPKPPDGGE